MAAPSSEKMVPPMADPSSENKVTKQIPEDIHFSILSKLPIKSINRFSSVSKSWYGLFENPDFLKMFSNNLVLKYHGDDVKLLFNINFKKLRLLSGDKFQHEVSLNMHLPPPFVGSNHLAILGSAVDGVICLYDVNNQKNIILCNPANGEKRVLPTNYAEDLGTVEDSITNIMVHGFGYDTVNQDFKVVQYVNNENVHSEGSPDETDSFWQVYSVKTNKWKKSQINFDGVPLPFLQDYPNGLEVYLDSVCHWLGRISTDDPLYLVSFNLTNYSTLLTLTPVDADVTESSLKLVVLNGSIAMITHHVSSMSYRIYTLGQIGVKESWTTLFNVASLPSIQNIVGAGKKGVIFYKGNEKDGKLFCFDLTTGVTFEEICFEAKMDVQQIVLYKESDQILSIIASHRSIRGINS